MRVLITGGTGFLGLHLKKGLVERSHEVTLYDQNILGSLRSTSATLPEDMIEGDITDGEVFKNALGSNHIETVIHLAGLLTEPCQADPVEGTRVNCLGSAVVFQAAVDLGIKRVIFGSSVAVFHPVSDAPQDDTPPIMPPSVYGATKVYIENLARVLDRTSPETKFTGIRFGWVYGPGRVRGWNVLQEVIEGFALEREEVAYPDYAEPNDWTYVDDAVHAVIACMESEGLERPVYNLNGDYRTVQEAVAYLKRRFSTVKAIPYQADLPPSAWNFNSSWLYQHTGFQPVIKLEEGLDLTAAGVRMENGKSV